MGMYNPRIVYPPEFDEKDCSANEYSEIEESFEDNPKELSPFELQYLSEYSSRDTEETLFYEQGEPV